MSSRVVRVELPELHEAQAEVVRGARRFNVLNCGRRWGKDVLLVDRVVDAVVEGMPVGWFAPAYKNLTEDWRELTAVLAPMTERKSEQDHRLELYGGGVMECWSLDLADIARGRKYKRVVVNEAAQAKGLRYAWERVIRATLVDMEGDAWFGSTPNGMGYFAQLYYRGQDEGEAEWKSWRYPTSANPYIPREEIEAARRELPERVFAQEFEAEILADEGAVFRNVRGTCSERPEGPVKGHQYVVGCDWGKVQDFSVFSVVDVGERKQVWQDRSNRLDYVVQVGRLKALCERYKPVVVIAEANSIGVPVIEQLMRVGVKVHAWTATNATKAAVIERLQLAMEQGTIRLLNDPVLVGELSAFEATRTPGGLVRYAAMEDGHDDCVVALALAWAGAIAPKRGRSKLSDFRYEAEGLRA